MIAPGSTLGILGGGQLGRMIGLAARRLGYRLAVLDPDPECAASSMADHVVSGGFDDIDAALRLASLADVVTLEIEKIDNAVLQAVSEKVPLRPGAHVLEVIRDRGRQRAWLESVSAPVGPWKLATNAMAIEQAASRFGGKCFVKRCVGGYDGRGQVEIEAPSEAAQAFHDLGQAPVVVEKALQLDFELSVLVARNPSGQVVTYAPARNHHEQRILVWSGWPAPLEPELVQSAQHLARRVADAIELEGVMVAEMFVTRDAELLINELAPRVHNSYHSSERVADTDQFEQAVRAACDLPLGSAAAYGHAAIVNLLGDVWLAQDPPAWSEALAVETASIHLYGKPGPRPGRKMGHISATGESLKVAVERAQRAFAVLSRR